MEDQGKEGNGKYEQCPVEDYVFKLEIIQCLLESPNKTVICEDSKLDFAKRKKWKNKKSCAYLSW